MPPVSSPSGSRTAIITWAVVFAILWVTSTIFAIYFFANASKVQEQYDNKIKSYIPSIIAESELQSDDVRKLKDAMGQEGSGLNTSMSVFRAALTQRDQMAQMIAGAGGKDTAMLAARTALEGAAAAAANIKVTVPTTDNLASALTAVSNGLNSTNQQVKDLTAQLDAAKKANADQAAQFDASRAEMNKTTEAIRAEQQKATTDVATYQQTKDASIGEIEKARDVERKAAQTAQDAANVQIADLNRQITQAKQQIDTLNNKFAERRINTKDPITRHPDGKIIRIPGKDVVYIDLGTADSVTPGLTFEVYDKIEGIPPVGDNSTDDNLPKGKASIEIVRVGTGSSECKVTRQTLGTQLVEGDLVANLVYDRNTKYNFVVYGDFDMDRNNVATAGEAEVIKKLVTQWGGTLQDVVNVDTDFVVLGKEPVLPTFTKEELQDPFNAKKLADAQAALEAYQNVRATAQNLHIPIVNQNRFLYLIGYYDQARR